MRLLTKINEDANFLENLWISDEAHYNLNGLVNKQNIRYWARINPGELHQRPLHSLKTRPRNLLELKTQIEEHVANIPENTLRRTDQAFRANKQVRPTQADIISHAEEKLARTVVGRLESSPDVVTAENASRPHFTSTRNIITHHTGTDEIGILNHLSTIYIVYSDNWSKRSDLGSELEIAFVQILYVTAAFVMSTIYLITNYLIKMYRVFHFLCLIRSSNNVAQNKA
ncbi:hypothetical protein J6590_011137 [Homalodisca vitripennis]|nr:hypothetical protein J6590_011137 [Homalodisca vitripennis]